MKNTYQLKMSNRKGVDDEYTKWMVCWFNKGYGSALIVNSLRKVRMRGKEAGLYKGNDTEDEGTLCSKRLKTKKMPHAPTTLMTLG